MMYVLVASLCCACVLAVCWTVFVVQKSILYIVTLVLDGCFASLNVMLGLF